MTILFSLQLQNQNDWPHRHYINYGFKISLVDVDQNIERNDVYTSSFESTILGEYLIAESLWRIVDDDCFGEITPENAQVFDVVTVDTDTVLSKQPVPVTPYHTAQTNHESRIVQYTPSTQTPD